MSTPQSTICPITGLGDRFAFAACVLPPKEIRSLDAHWTVRLLLFPDWLEHVLKDYPETNLVPRLT